MSSDNEKLLKRVSTNFEDEYIQSLHERYSITMSPKKDGKLLETCAKMRNGKINDSSRLSAEYAHNAVLNNSIPDHPSKFNRKKLDPITHNSTYLRAANLSKKRKRQGSDQHLDTMSLRKKRKVESIAEKLKVHSEAMLDYHSNTHHVLRSVKTEMKEKKNHVKTGLVRKKDIELDKIDKNSNLVQDPVRTSKSESPYQISLKEFYSSNIKDVSETSPFKGKMSAFEISLLKGKQSSERRKSLEAATLRSSPRLNANISVNPHSAKRSARSLTPSLNEKSLARRNAKSLRLEKKARKKSRDRSKSLGAVSPSSIENQLVTTKTKSASKRRSLRTRTKETADGVKSTPKMRRNGSLRCSSRPGKPPSSPTIHFRLNGSPKLKGLPAVLSLNTLSGYPQRVQGSSFSSSIPQGMYANKISGTPPPLRTMNSTALVMDEPATYFPPVSRPSSLPIDHSPNPTDSGQDDSSALKSDYCESETINETQNCKLEQDLVSSVDQQLKVWNTLGESPSKHASGTLTPVPRIAEGRHSRRSSSRSSTPNVSPIKTEVLTPSCTPCSTPKRSPSPGRSEQKNIKIGYLFSKYDDVLVRWHDGLFYIGKILRIEDKNAKCLLRYEDNSEYWSLFKDIHRMVTEEEICCICLGESSEAPNEIVICDHCNQGFHQKCHMPYIDPDHVVDPDDEWFCRQCVFLMTVKVGGAIKEGSRAEDLKIMKHILPYTLDSLSWDVQHKNNAEQLYCYCGGPGIWYQKMLQCCRCKQWFHEACLQCTEFPFLIGDSFFIFVCLPCNSGQEYMKRLEVDWGDIIHIVLFNLSLDSRKKYFDLSEEILPWMEENWNLLHMYEKQEFKVEEVKESVLTALQNNRTRFSNAREVKQKVSQWGLRMRVPPPRIQVNLPVPDMLTDDIMKGWKIKGRRSKVLSPLKSSFPVKKLGESPSRSRIDSSHLNAKDDGTFDPVVSKDHSALKSQRKQRIVLPLLDKLIPHTPFDSHPFKTEIEQEVDWDQAILRKKIWESYQNQGDNKSGTLPSVDNSPEGPPVLEKVEPVIPQPSVNSLSMPVIQEKKKKSGRLSIKLENEQEDKGSCRRSSRKLINPPNLLEPTGNKTEINVKKVKSAEGNYFCAYDKLGFGQGFHVLGRRVNQLGRAEFMINWDC